MIFARKLLEAHQDGEGTLEELAEQFRVSAWARKISACFHRTRKMERPEGQPRGRKSKVTAEVEEVLKRRPSRSGRT
jgi:hypothetical protein